MFEFYLIIIIILITILSVSMNYYNRRQANALDETAQAATNWLHFEIRKNRAERKDNLVITNAVEWLEAHSDTKILRKDRVFEDLPAIELIVEDGKLVVSPLKPNHLLAALKKYRSNRSAAKAVKATNVPLISTNWKGEIKADVTSKGLLDEPWFDIEAQRIGELLNLQWGAVDCLWFYHIKK